MTKIVNAKITNTILGKGDYPCLTFFITVKLGNGGSCCIGGYALDRYSESLDKRIPHSLAMEPINKIMEVVGVSSWEDLKGKYIRVVDDGFGMPINTIGNLMDDKWFNLKEYFNTWKEEVEQ